MKKQNKLLILLLLFAGLYACKSSKQPASVALQTMAKEERFNTILQAGIPYNRFSSNLKWTVLLGQKSNEISVDAQLRITKDEAIQLSLRMPILGSEIFKIVITPDQLLIIDRMHKQYLFESMQNIKAEAPFDFDYYSLQALLTNQLFIAGKKTVTPADYDRIQIEEDPFSSHIIYTDQQKITYNFTSDYSNRIQSAQMDYAQSHLQCTYTDWGLTSNKRTFPMTTNLTLQTKDEMYKMNFTCKSVDLDTDFTINGNIPDRYKQITLKQVITQIKNLI
jgi:hypothetical protein